MGSFWKSHFVTLCLLAIDVIALSILWGESWELIRAFDHRFVRPINPKDLYLQFLPALLLIWVAVLAFFHQYDHRLRISSLNQVSDILKAGFVLLLVTLAFANLTKRPTEQLANRVIMPFCVGATAYLYASRSLLRIVKDRMRKAGVGLTRAAIIGAGETGRRVALRIQTHPEIGYELVGFIDRRAAELGATIAGIPVIGDGSRLVDLLLQYRIEEVFLAVPNMDQHAALDLVVECEA
ncbi:MAG TPA: hypothetical protein PK847_14260, partial [Candidatus Sumerlaeota bacterium]|nr:hypothetical protein [Candidatus Sumerlaeota bacterium]